MWDTYEEIKMGCKIGKKTDRSDCAKKDCEHCRHWVETKVTCSCYGCMGNNPECGNEECKLAYKKFWRGNIK